MRVKLDCEAKYLTEEDPWGIGEANSKRYERYVESIRLRARGRTSVLDVGCGFGAMLARLRPDFERLHGIELSADAIAKGAERYPFIAFEQGSIEALGRTEADRFELRCDRLQRRPLLRRRGRQAVLAALDRRAPEPRRDRVHRRVQSRHRGVPDTGRGAHARRARVRDRARGAAREPTPGADRPPAPAHGRADARLRDLAAGPRGTADRLGGGRVRADGRPARRLRRGAGAPDDLRRARRARLFAPAPAGAGRSHGGAMARGDPAGSRRPDAPTSQLAPGSSVREPSTDAMCGTRRSHGPTITPTSWS